MWYDTLSDDKRQEIKDFIVDSKNPDKDPNYTKHFLDVMLKHAAIFSKDGKYHRLKAHTRENEHVELRKYLRQTKAEQTLEVGFAYGASALVFAEHHQRQKNSGISHTIIDPNQSGSGEGHWDNIGTENLKRVGFSKGRNWRLVEETSVKALPDLFSKYGVFLDVALIDGWHLFDYTLIDIFYCLEMLKVGGILIVDDKRMKAISAVSKYVNRAYPHIIDICPSCRSILVLKKKTKDIRDWDADEKVNFNLT
jgi:predicted O-methyltransferase YrrM